MDQMEFPFPLDEEELTGFLTQWCTIENEQDRLRDELRLLKKAYQEKLPLRGLLTAVKVVRARRKLDEHPKEPLAYVHQDALQVLVALHLDQMAHDGAVPDTVLAVFP